MAKKNTGGKNFKKQKKEVSISRELIFREDEQDYARITRTLGDSRFECECFGLNVTKIAHLRGIFKKRIWMGVGDIILVSMRDFDYEKCDIIHKYLPEETLRLKSLGELPSSVNLQATPFDIASGIVHSNSNLDDSELNLEFV